MTQRDKDDANPPLTSRRLVLLAFGVLAVIVTAGAWSGLSIREILAAIRPWTN